jgi:hypothetical protein
MRVLFYQHLLALVRAQALVDRVLVLARVRHAERRGVAIEPIGRQQIGLHADAVQVAPGEHLEGARVLGVGALLQQPDVGRLGRALLHALDHVGKAWQDGLLRLLLVLGRGLRRGGRRRFGSGAGGVGRGSATIGAVEIVELRMRRAGQERRERDKGKPAHARQYIRIGACLIGLLALGGCSSDFLTELNRPAFLGNQIDRPPPAVDVVSGGPTGVLLTGPYVPDVPDKAVDAVVATGLKEWLTFAERQSLAMASEHAAVATTGAPVAWTAADGTGATTAKGSAVAVSQAFRSLRGEICRDVRQAVDKDNLPHAQTVSLCRTEIATGEHLWTVAAPD